MSLSSAINSALTGLTANARASALVSENIANALTPGYARRTLDLEARGEPGLGVRVAGIVRHADPGVIASRRAADADQAGAAVRSEFYARVTAVTGIPSDEESIAARMAAFENSLIAAASRPDSAERLDDAVAQAKDLAGLLRAATDTVQTLRSQADDRIATQVGRLNEALAQVETLNSKIVSVAAAGQSTASLEDQRQALIDEINGMVPVKTIQRENGRVALYASGGAVLVDSQAVTVSFSQTHTIVAEMNVGSGVLSGLEINGKAISTASGSSPLAGGSLIAQFEVRDELAVSVQGELDAVARDLIERFETAGLDSTVAAGDPGLFTDGGDALDIAQETGLAGRIEVNAAVDADQGGASWRLRDGLGAAVAGPTGDARFLQALTDVLGETRTPGSGSFGSGQLSAPGLASAFLSSIAGQASSADRTLSIASVTQSEMQEIELSRGVDTDTELGNLLLIEQAYAANARVIEVVSGLMDTLLRI